MRNVTEIQQFVAAAGFDPGPIDGVLGQRTVDAISAYLVKNGRPTFNHLPPYTLIEVNNAIWPPTPKGLPMPNILGSLFSGLFGNLFNWQLIQGYIRSALLGLGGALVTDGVLSGAQLNDAVGAIMVILGIVLSAVSNNTKVKALAVVSAVDAHPAITVTPAEGSPSGKPTVSVNNNIGQMRAAS